MGCCGRKLSPQGEVLRDQITALQQDISDTKKEFYKTGRGVAGSQRRDLLDQMHAAVAPKREKLRAFQIQFREMRFGASKCVGPDCPDVAPSLSGIVQEAEPTPEIKS